MLPNRHKCVVQPSKIFVWRAYNHTAPKRRFWKVEQTIWCIWSLFETLFNESWQSWQSWPKYRTYTDTTDIIGDMLLSLPKSLFGERKLLQRFNKVTTSRLESIFEALLNES